MPKDLNKYFIMVIFYCLAGGLGLYSFFTGNHYVAALTLAAAMISFSIHTSK